MHKKCKLVSLNALQLRLLYVAAIIATSPFNLI